MTTRCSGKHGRVARLHAHEVSGPAVFAKIEGSDFEPPADLVPLATGLLHPQHEGLVHQLGLERDARGNALAGEEDWAASVAGVYACGDARRGQSLIVWAIAEGRRCAAAVDRYLAALDGGVRGDDLAPALAAG
jgi:glutamate synthase (NADPH) small chain